MVNVKRIAILVLVTCLSVTLLGADWPNWRGPNYDGISVETDWNPKALESPDIVWTAEIGTGFSTISIASGSPRGELHTKENIGARLNMRDFLDTMRSSGVEMSGGPAAFSQRDKQDFANNLDRFLTKYAD